MGGITFAAKMIKNTLHITSSFNVSGFVFLIK